MTHNPGWLWRVEVQNLSELPLPAERGSTPAQFRLSANYLPKGNEASREQK
jgi:hypothetical protein